MARSMKAQARMLALAAGTVAARRKDADSIVVNGRVLTRAQANDLKRAAQLAKGSNEQRRQAAAILREVERQLAQASEAERVEAGLNETRALAGSGLVVEHIEEARFVTDAHGCVVRHEGELVVRVERAKRLRRVDGLASLLQAGTLSLELYEIGMLYRTMLLRSQAPVGSSLGERSGVQAVNSDGAVWAALERGYAALRLRLVKVAVRDDRALMVLDAVAGKGQSLRSVSGGGKAVALDGRRLVEALRIAGPLLKTTDVQLKKGLVRGER